MTTYNLENYFEQPKGKETNNKIHLEGSSIYNNNEYTAAEINSVLSGGAGQYYVTKDTAQTVTGDKTWDGKSIYNGNTYTTEEVDASLSLYETYTHTTIFNGPWPDTAPIGCEIIKTGNLVTLRIPKQIYAANVAVSIVMVTLIPSKYRIQQTMNYIIRAISNSSGVAGFCSIESSGIIYIYASLDNGVFASSGNAGFEDINVSWIIA